MMKTWSSSRSMSRTAQSARRASRCESRARRPIRRGKGTLLPFPAYPIRPTAPYSWCSTGKVAADLTTRPLLLRLHRGDRVGPCTHRPERLALSSRAPPKPASKPPRHTPAMACAGGFLTSAARNRVTSRSTCCASTWTMPSASRIMPSKGCCAGEGDSRSGRPRSAPILGQ